MHSSNTSRGKHAGPAEKLNARSAVAAARTATLRRVETTAEAALRATTFLPAKVGERSATPEVMLRAAIVAIGSKAKRGGGSD